MSKCYVGRCKCGSVVSAVVIEPMGVQDAAKWRREVAKFCADNVRDGRDIEQMETEQVRVTLESCKCPDRKKPAAKQREMALSPVLPGSPHHG